MDIKGTGVTTKDLITHRRHLDILNLTQKCYGQLTLERLSFLSDPKLAFPDHDILSKHLEFI